MLKNTELFKKYREKFTEKHPSGSDDSKAPEFYGNIIEAFNFNAKNENIAFIVAAHFVHSLPYFLEALSSIGDIAVLISKQSGVVKKVHKTISEIYSDLIVKDINKENLNNNSILTFNFFKGTLKKWKDHKFIILDHGGYFAPRINDVLLKFSDSILGVVEHTWNGEVKYKEQLKLQPFPFPVLSIAHSELKKLESESVARSIVDAVTVKMAGEGLNQDITRLKNILIIGYGNIGKCIAKTLKQRLAIDQTIYICDNSEERLLEAGNDGFLPNVTKDKHKFLQNADLIITATSSQALMEEHFLKLKKNVVIVCATSSDDQFDKNALEKYDNFLPKNEKEKHKKIIQKQPCVKYQHLEDKEKIFYLFANGDSANFLIGSTPHPIIHLIMSSIYVNTGRLLNNHSELSSNEIHLSQKDDDSLIKEIWEETYGPVWGVLRQELEHLAWGFSQLFGNKLVPEKINKAIFNYIQKAKLDPSRQALEIIVSHLELIKQQQRRLKGDITDPLLSSLILSGKKTLKQEINISEEKTLLLSKYILPMLNEKYFKKLLSEQEQLADNKLFFPLLTNAWERAITEGRASKKVVLFCPQLKFFIELIEHLQTAGINACAWENEHIKADFYLEIEIEENRPILVLKNATKIIRHRMNNYLSILQWLITTVFGAGEEYIKWFENELTVSRFNAFEGVPILPPNLFRRETLLNEIVQKFDEKKNTQRKVIIYGGDKSGKTTLALMFCYEQYRKYYNEIIWVERFQLIKLMYNTNFEEKTNCLLVINDVYSYDEIENCLPNANIDIIIIANNKIKSGLGYVQVNNLTIEEARHFIVQQLGKRSVDKIKYFEKLIKAVGLNIYQLANALEFIKQNCVSIPRFLSLHNVEDMVDEKLKIEINSISALMPMEKNNLKQTSEFEGNQFVIFEPKQRLRPWHLPRQNPNFVGRRAVMRDLHDKLKIEPLSQCKPITLTACEGLGGIGKTQIAIEYAYQNIKHYRLICWIPAQDKTSIDNSYLELIGYLNINVNREDAVEKKIESVKYYFQNNQGNLLIFDDAKDYETIKPYIPELGSAILVTSRYKDINWQHTLEVKEFTLKEAMKYVKKILQIKNNNQDRLIEELCETMGCLPLALAQATAYIWEEEITITEYLEIYHTNKSILSNTAMPVGGKHVPVYVTYCIAIEAIKKQSSYAAELINYCAFLDNNNIPGYLLERIKHDNIQSKEIVHNFDKNSLIVKESVNNHKKAVSFEETMKLIKQCSMIAVKENINNHKRKGSFEAALGLLQQYSLVTINEDNYQFSLHQLLQEIIKQQIQMQPNVKQNTMENLLWVFAEYFYITSDIDTLDIFKLMSRRILLPHLQIFLQYDPKTRSLSPEVLPEYEYNVQIREKFLFAIMVTYAVIGNVEMLEKSMEKLKSHMITFEGSGILEEDSLSETLKILDFWESGGGDERIQIEQEEQSLQIFEIKYGKKSSEVAAVMRKLGGMCMLTDPKKALSYNLKAKEIFLEVGSISTDTFFFLELESTIAQAHGLLGNENEKYRILKEILSKSILKPGKKHPFTIEILHKLGETCLLLSKSEEGIEHLEKALSWAEKFYTKDDEPFSIVSISKILGIGYQQSNQESKSRDLLERALKIIRNYYGDDHLKTSEVLSHLGDTYGSLNNHKKKLEILQEAMKIKQKHYPSNHPEIADIMIKIADAYGELGNLQEKCRLLEDALLILKEHYDADHEKIGFITLNLGRCYKTCEQSEKALPYFQHACSVLTKISLEKQKVSNKINILNKEDQKSISGIERVATIFKEASREDKIALIVIAELYEVEQKLNEKKISQQLKSLDIFGFFNKSNITNNKEIFEKNNNSRAERKKEIYFKLIDNIHRIVELISPAVQQELIENSFINYLKQKELLASDFTWEQMVDLSEEFSMDFAIIRAYLRYHLLESEEEPHENVSQAFDSLQNNFQHN